MSKNEPTTESAWYLDPKTGELIDPDDAPELTKEWFAKAEMHIGGKPVRRGRPPIHDEAKEKVTLRINRVLLANLRQTGKGWQARVEMVLEREVARKTGNRLMGSPNAVVASHSMTKIVATKTAVAFRKTTKLAAAKKPVSGSARNSPSRHR